MIPLVMANETGTAIAELLAIPVMRNVAFGRISCRGSNNQSKSNLTVATAHRGC